MIDWLLPLLSRSIDAAWVFISRKAQLRMMLMLPGISDAVPSRQNQDEIIISIINKSETSIKIRNLIFRGADSSGQNHDIDLLIAYSDKNAIPAEVLPQRSIDISVHVADLSELYNFHGEILAVTDTREELRFPRKQRREFRHFLDTVVKERDLRNAELMRELWDEKKGK